MEDHEREKIINTMADIIGASCTCSGRTDRSKNVAMAVRIVEGLEKKALM